MKIRILLVDDNTLFRKGLSALLSTHPDFSVVGDLGSGKEVSSELMNVQPDLVLMDMRLAGVPGLNTVGQLKRRQPQLKVVLLTAIRAVEYVRMALSLGIDGYVLKDASYEELVMSLHSVAMGKKYLSPDVSGHVVESFLHPESASSRKSKVETLTSRERGVLQLIAEGRTNRSAAEFLCVSAKTVEKHRSSLMQKLGLRNAAELTIAAMEMGLIERPLSISRLLENPGAAYGAA